MVADMFLGRLQVFNIPPRTSIWPSVEISNPQTPALFPSKHTRFDDNSFKKFGNFSTMILKRCKICDWLLRNGN